MSDIQTIAPLFLWQAVKHVQSRSPVTLTDSEVLRLMGIPLDAAEAVAQIRQMKQALLRAEVELSAAKDECARALAPMLRGKENADYYCPDDVADEHTVLISVTIAELRAAVAALDALEEP